MKLMILRMAASTLVFFAATTAALAQTVLPPHLFDKFGLGRVQSELDATPRVDADVDYSPWTRTCQPACLTRKSGMLGRQSVVSVFLVEPTGSGSKALQVWLPRDFRKAAGARMFIDDDPPRLGGYTDCRAVGCAVEFTVDAAFVARLRTGRYLQIQGVNAAGSWMSYRLPLDDFAAAADSTPMAPAVYREPGLLEQPPRTPPR
jgi:invasion protein IalB